MKQFLVALLLVASFACIKRPAPVATETQPVLPEERPAIAVEYVAVPTMTVYRQPSVDAEKSGSYQMSEAISILSRKGEWCEIRTFDGAGWVKASDLMDAAKKAELEKDTVPRFFVSPQLVEATRARGEIVFHAKVNTDGDVVEVKTIQNTTGNLKLADANAEELKKARFYPLIDQGQRKVFVYEHKVYY